MLFEETIEPRCAYCARGVSLDGGEFIACPKRGVTSPGSHCRAFRYDPLKRTPPRPIVPKTAFSPEDFQL